MIDQALGYVEIVGGYDDDGPCALELLESIDHDRFPTESAYVRRATLEDVFLRLTGRTLRE